MKIVGEGNETYLYINGLRIEESVSLGNDVELIPANSSFDGKIVADLVENDFDYGVALIFLPQVESQLHIIADDAKSLAIKSWNALWDLVLLSAIFNCDAEGNLQCDTPVEQLTNKCNFHITNYHFHGFSRPLYCLSENDITWMRENFSIARDLLQKDKFRNAVHCLATYHWHSLAQAQLALLWSGIEGIFEINSELVFRLSLYISSFLERDDKEKRIEIFNMVKNLYKQRSKAVHGSGKINDSKQAVESSVQLLQKIIIQCINSKDLPDQKKLIF